MKVLFYVAFLACPSFLLAQDANALLQQAQQAYDAGDYPQAQQAYQSAAQQFQQTTDWELYLKCGVGIGNSQLRSGEIEKAEQTFDLFLKNAEAKVKTPSEQLALIYKGKASVYYSLDRYREAEPFFKKAADMRLAAVPNSADLVRDFNNLGTIYRMNGKVALASQALKKALEIAQKSGQKDPVILATLYENLGTNLSDLGNYDEAIDYFDRALGFVQGLENEPLLRLSKGQALWRQKSFKDATRELKRSIQSAKLLPQTPEVYLNVSNAYSLLSDVFQVQKGLDSAVYYARQAHTIAQKQFAGTVYALDYTVKLADLNVQKGDLNAAKSLLDQAQVDLSLVEAVHTTRYSFYQALSNFYQASGDYPAALQATQQQLTSLIEGYTQSNPQHNPDEPQFQGALSLDFLTDALANKARLYYQAFQAGKAGAKELDFALQTLFLFDKAVNRFREQTNADGTGLSWSDLTLDAYNNALDICWTLFQQTKNEQYLHHAFYFSEKSKAMVLLEAFQKSKADQIAGISTAELQDEQSQKLSLAALERDLYLVQQKLKKTPEEQALARQLETEIFEKKRAYEAFLKSLEAKNPEYFRLKNNLQIADVAAVRAMLGAEQAMLQYFIGETSSYLFKITATTFDCYPLDLTEEKLTPVVRDLREGIYEYYLGAERTDETMLQMSNQYVQQASSLYQKLLAIAAPLPRRLLIVPASSLSDVPFDALLMEMPQDPLQYDKHAYLLRNHIVSYCYSGTLLQEMRNRQHQPAPHTFLAFAPEFSSTSASSVRVTRGERFSLSPLEFNKVEVDDVAKLLGTGDVFKGKDALESKFYELASQYRILHFATHGMARDKDPDFSLLAFTEVPDTLENEFLYVRELYNLQLNADLVVLSACETGLGKLYRGEGVVSLARGFAQAGAKSIFNTLWSVNDQATSQIITSFYTYLQQGKEKDEALQLAKLDYINKGNRNTTAPFLWAPYILVGDTRPMDGLGGGTAWWWWLAGAGAVLVVGMAALKFRRKE